MHRLNRSSNGAGEDHPEAHKVDIEGQFCMESAFTGNISLHLGLVDTIDGGPGKSPSNDNCPERVSLQRVRIKIPEV